ncbi:MAG: prepilin peptidase [Candidatus Latescibacterota bacterium]|jgi:Flp pilus assembly protein protease CpaA
MQISILELAMLALVMGAGVYVSFTDITTRRIPNRCTYGLLVLGLGGQAGFWIAGRTGPAAILLVFAGGLALAALLHAQGFWAPGDAKLYWATVVALPPTLFPDHAPLSVNAPVWAVIINALVLNFLFLLGVLLVQHRRGFHRWPRLASLRGGLRLAGEVGGFLGLVLGTAGIAMELPLLFMEALLLTLVGYLLVERLISPAYRLTLVLPGWALSIYLILTTGFVPQHALLLLASWAILGAYRCIRQSAGRGVITTVEITALRPGMIPLVAIQRAASPEKQTPRYVLSEQSAPDALCHRGRPLSAEAIGRLRSLSHQGRFSGFGDRLAVEQDIAFAPFLVAGALLAVIFGGAPVNALVRLLEGL